VERGYFYQAFEDALSYATASTDGTRPIFKTLAKSLSCVPTILEAYAFESRMQLQPLICHVKETYDRLMKSGSMTCVAEVRAAYKSEEGKELSICHKELVEAATEFNEMMVLFDSARPKGWSDSQFLKSDSSDFKDAVIVETAQAPLASMSLVQSCFVKLNDKLNGSGHARSTYITKTKNNLKTSGLLKLVDDKIVEEVHEMVRCFSEKEKGQRPACQAAALTQAPGQPQRTSLLDA